MVVSLASVPRLRKLRKTEAEDLVSGREYVKRLRRQFEMLNPVPDWAVEATQRPSKKRRVMRDEDDEDEDMDVDMDEDEEEIEAEPLGKLLRDAGGLIRRTDATAGRKRKLRPETLDIQRTKDIDGTQPVIFTDVWISCGETNTATVCYHVLVISPEPVTTSVFWTRIDSLPSSYSAITSCSNS